MGADLRKPSLLLSEQAGYSNAGLDLLAALDDDSLLRLHRISPLRKVAAGEMVFRQGDAREGIYIILSGQVRIFYTGPSGREITLAYWTPRNFIGGPEVFGDSPHMWSGQAVRPTELLPVPGAELRALVQCNPSLAIALIEAMEHKGRCFSALIQMLGTCSAAQRLAQLLSLMGEFDGKARPDGIVIGRTLTSGEDGGGHPAMGVVVAGTPAGGRGGGSHRHPHPDPRSCPPAHAGRVRSWGGQLVSALA